MSDDDVPTIVPNLKDVSAIVFYNDGEYVHCSIVAWKVYPGGWATPISCNGAFVDADVYCLVDHVRGANTYIFWDDSSYDDFDEAIRRGVDEMREREKQRIERRDKQKPAVAP